MKEGRQYIAIEKEQAGEYARISFFLRLLRRLMDECGL